MQMKNNFCLLVLACVMAADTCKAQDSSFNFEISKRTENTIRSFMSTPKIPNRLTHSAMMLEHLSEEEPDSLNDNFYAQIISFPSIYMIYAGFETGYFSGYFRKGGQYQYQFTVRSAGPADDEILNTRSYHLVNNYTGVANMTISVRDRQYDPRMRGWYKEAKAAQRIVWSSIYVFASSNQLGLTACKPVFNATGALEGVLAVDYTLGDIDRFLSDAFSGEGRAVFIVENTDEKLLVGSSTLDPILRLSDSGDPERVRAVDSADNMVRETAEYLDSENWPERLSINRGRYIQVKNYKDGTLDWIIVVVMPSAETEDYVRTGTTIHTAIVIMSTLGIIMPMVCAALVIAGRKANIWRAAQPVFLVGFAIAASCMSASTLIYLGENTTTACAARPWLFNICFTLMFAFLFVKVHRVAIIFNNPSMKKVRMTIASMFGRILLLVIIDVVLQTVWMVVDPVKPTVIIDIGAQGAYVERIICSSDSPALNGLTIGYKALLILWGCLLAYKTRNVHSAFAESKMILTVMYNIALVGLIVLLLYNFLDATIASKVLIHSFGVLSVISVSCTLVFGPRAYQLYKSGDIDMQELVRQQTMMTQQYSMNTQNNGEKDEEIKKLKLELKKMEEKYKHHYGGSKESQRESDRMERGGA